MPGRSGPDKRIGFHLCSPEVDYRVGQKFCQKQIKFYYVRYVRSVLFCPIAWTNFFHSLAYLLVACIIQKRYLIGDKTVIYGGK
jgi:hypothetical protein